MRFFHWLFGYCYCCQRWWMWPETRRQNTQYANEADNYVRCCLECFEEREKYWAEQWREYYSGCL